MKRRKIRTLRVKIDLLKKSHQGKIDLKLADIRQKREEKLKRFRLNYLPLCLDEDLERYAKYFSQKEDEN